MPNSRKSDFSRDGSGSFPRALRNIDRAPAGSARSGAYSRKKETDGDFVDKRANFAIRAFAGFATLVLLHALLLWLAVRVLRSAGAVSWGLGVWHSVVLAFVWAVWRSLDSYIFGKARADQ